MNAASLHGPARVPVAAHPVVLWTSGGGGAGATAAPSAAAAVTPADGQGFVPAAAAQQPSADAQATATSAQPGTQSTATKGLPLEEGLAAFTKLMGDAFGDPIIAPDGSVYVPVTKAAKQGEQLALRYLKIGTVDKATGTIAFTEPVLAKLQAAAAETKTERKLVKIDDQYVYQTFGKDEQGATIVTKIEPATEEDLKAEQARREQAAAKEAAADDQAWMNKLRSISSNIGLFSSTASLVNGLSRGTNPLTGRPGATWMQGYILANRLNGKAEGKLLPKWMQEGIGATVIDIATTAYGMLDMASDVRTIRQALGAAAPTPLVNPNAVQDLVKQGLPVPQAQALADIGTKLRVGMQSSQLPVDASLQLVETTRDAALYAPVTVKDAVTGAVREEMRTVSLPKDAVRTAFNATEPGLDAGLRARQRVDAGVVKGLGALKGLIEPAMIAGAGLSAYMNGRALAKFVKANGAQALVDTQQGRNAALGAATSVAFLGIFTLPKILPLLGVAAPMVGAAASAANLAANVIGGVQMLDRYGLFGDKGFLNHDAVRAAFLIPPLTPIGGLAFLMKRRKDKREEEAARVAAAKQLQQSQLKQQLALATQQLQQSGTIAGATRDENGFITVATGVPADTQQVARTISASQLAAVSRQQSAS